ncbi:MAG: trypsin-like peptidase domain-containing protein [Oscillospiraceae bacterium]|nr:trypsin-like peptidase domain-containing protein [Oscillospiraceae bacterium]
MYEQDNESFGGANGMPPSDVQNTEYSFSRENIPHRSYMDANFVPQNEEPNGPRAYYTPPVKPPKLKKEKKSGGMAKLIVACLICALLGGVGGGALVVSQLPEAAVADNSGSSLNISDSDNTETHTASPVSSGELLTGAQIYSLGCAQAVGISTDVTYTNYFGAKTTAAVSGSGFIVTSDGYIVTNYHVIADAYTEGYKVSVILYNGDKYDAKIVGVEEASDVAVLKIDATGLTAATLGDSDSLQVGESVYAVGNPLGELSFSMTSGMVSALDRDITTQDSTTGQTTTNNMFQIDAAVNEGNSGGPVYNQYGEVIGIVTAKYSDTGVEGLGFAIPINDVTDIVDQLIKNGYVSGKANFGITVTTVDSTVAQYYNMVEGAYVYSVTSGSCSDKAGLKVGDIITAINDVEVKSSSELTSEKKNYKAGDTVTLKVYRQPDDNSKKGDYIEIKITLDENIPTSTTQSDSNEQSNTKNNENSGDNSLFPTVPNT